MPSYNSVTLMGNLTRDFELKYLANEKAVANGAMAVNKKWKAKDGTSGEKVVYVDLTIWGAIGEAASKHLKKGDPLFIEGELESQNWTDKQTGAKRSKLLVVVRKWEFLSGKDAVEGDGKEQGPDDF